jgi:hypothetical protein
MSVTFPYYPVGPQPPNESPATSLDPYFLYQRIAVALERIADALDRESAAPVPEQPKSSGR